MDKQSHLKELGRNLIVYLGGSWFILEVLGFLTDKYALSGMLIDTMLIIIIGGFPSIFAYALFRNKFSKKALITYSINLLIIITSVAFWILRFNIEGNNKVVASNNNSTNIESLAVLPIDNLTGESDQDYLTIGIQDALISELGQVPSLRVISRKSTTALSASMITLPEIASRLGVQAIIESSLLRSDNKIRLRVRLISVNPSEQSLWTKTYEKPVKNIFDLYSELTRAIALEINLHLNPEQEKKVSEKQTIDPEVYKLVLKGNYYWEQTSIKSLHLALDCYKKAIALEPEYAAAHIGEALTWVGLVQHGAISYDSASKHITPAISKAQELTNSSHELHHYLAIRNTWGVFQWNTAENEFQQAIKLKPNAAVTRAYYAHYLQVMGRNEESNQQMEMALRFDPLNPLIRILHAMNLNMQSRYDEAIEVVNYTMDNMPEIDMAYSTLRKLYHNKGRYDDAFTIWQTSYKKDNELLTILNDAYNSGGYFLALQSVASKLAERRKEKFVPAWRIGTLYTRAGNIDQAINWLEEAYKENDSNLPYLGADPIFKILSDEPRYIALLDSLQLPGR